MWDSYRRGRDTTTLNCHTAFDDRNTILSTRVCGTRLGNRRIGVREH